MRTPGCQLRPHRIATRNVAGQSVWHQPKDENTLFLNENGLSRLSMKYIWSSSASKIFVKKTKSKEVLRTWFETLPVVRNLISSPV